MGRRDRSLIIIDRLIFSVARSVVCPRLLLNSVAAARMASARHFLGRRARDGDLVVNACSEEYNFH